MNSKAASAIWRKFTDRVARRYEIDLPKQKLERLVKKYQGERDETRKKHLWFKMQGITAPVATVAFLEEVASMKQRDFQELIAVILSSMEKTVEEEGKAYLDYEVKLKDPLMVIEDLTFTAALMKRVEDTISKKRSLSANPRLVSRLLMFSSMREFTMALGILRLKPLFDIMEVAKARVSADENWMISVVALSLEENMIKTKLAELGLSEEEISKLGKDFNAMASRVVTLVKAKEGRQMRIDALLLPGYRRIRNKLIHEGHLWKSKRDETSRIVAHVLKLSHELWQA